MATDTKKQHYVPRLLLKNFCSNTRQIFVFDKSKEKTFCTKDLMNIAQENHFNEITDKTGKKHSVEPMYSEIENKVAPIIQKIIKTKKIWDLTQQEKIILSEFMLIQTLRTRAQLENLKYMSSKLIKFTGKVLLYKDPKMQKSIKKLGISMEQAEQLLNDAAIEFNENYIKTLNLNLINKFFTEDTNILKRIINMEWFLFKDSTKSLWISDNPLVMYNDKNFGPYGNIGWMVPYIQIYLPLSDDLILGLWCPLIFKEIGEEFIKLAIKAPSIARQWWRSQDFLVARDNKTCITLSTDNVMFYNSLQVEYSERFLFSSKNDFSLVNKMISDNIKYKSGFRPNIH